MTWDCTISGNLSFESIPSAAVMDSKRVDAVALASDDHAYHKSLVDSSWSTNWDDLGGPLSSAPVITSFSPIRVVFLVLAWIMVSTLGIGIILHSTGKATALGVLLVVTLSLFRIGLT
jgi:hypothetical protein